MKTAFAREDLPGRSSEASIEGGMVIKAGSLSRRKFILIGTGGVVSGVWLPACSRSAPSGWAFFSTEEGTLVEAIVEQLIPSDQDPGGKWAGVARFLDRQLTGFYRRHQERYRTGLANVERSAVAIKGKPFVALASDEQIEVLETLEKGTVPEGIWTGESSSSFFGLLLDHSMQGYYGSPRHGGNRDFVGYKVVGLDYPQILGRMKAPKA